MQKERENDYIGVPNHQRWMNGGKFDGGRLSPEEKDLRDFYKRLLSFSTQSAALMGDYSSIHAYNREKTDNYNDKVFSFVRWNGKERLLVVSNFDADQSYNFNLKLPAEIVKEWKLKSKKYTLTDQLYGSDSQLNVEDGIGSIDIEIGPLESFVFKLEQSNNKFGTTVVKVC